MSRQNMAKWCQNVKNRYTNTHDEERSGRISIVTEEFIEKVEQLIRNIIAVRLSKCIIFGYCFIKHSNFWTIFVVELIHNQMAVIANQLFNFLNKLNNIIFFLVDFFKDLSLIIIL